MIQLTRRLLFLSASVGLLFGCGAGGADGENVHDAPMMESVVILDESTQVLAGITDVASAEAAAPKLEELAARLGEIRARGKELFQSTPDAPARPSPQVQIQVEEAKKRFAKAGQTAAAIPGVRAAIDEAMRGFGT